MSKSPFRLSVVMPVYAEEESIAEVVSDLYATVGEELEEILLIVATASPVSTFSICEDLSQRFPPVRLSLQQREPGLGFAIRQGIAQARGSHILIMDSDGEMDASTVPAMITVAQEHHIDLVVGSRWIPGGGVQGYDQLKYILNRSYQLIFRVLYRTSIHDLTLGFKLGRTEVFQALPWTAQFHSIACETTLRIIRAGYRVAEVPTVWRCRKAGVSKNPFRHNFLYVSMALSILLGKPEY